MYLKINYILFILIIIFYSKQQIEEKDIKLITFENIPFVFIDRNYTDPNGVKSTVYSGIIIDIIKELFSLNDKKLNLIFEESPDPNFGTIINGNFF
jgi:DNA-binding LacI/PurR family transcriptional regulator